MFLLTVRERITYFATTNLASHLIDKKLKPVKIVKISDWSLAIKSIGDEIWCCQHDGICVFDDTLHHLRHMNLGWTRDALLLSQGHIVITGKNGMRIISKTGIVNVHLAIMKTSFTSMFYINNILIYFIECSYLQIFIALFHYQLFVKHII